MENGEKKILPSPDALLCTISRYRSAANRLFASVTLMFRVPGCPGPAWIAGGVSSPRLVPLQPVHVPVAGALVQPAIITRRRMRRDATASTFPVQDFMAESGWAFMLNLALTADRFAVIHLSFVPWLPVPICV